MIIIAVVAVVIVIIAAHAKVNTEADGHCYNDNCETRRDKLETMWDCVRSLYYSTPLATKLPCSKKHERCEECAVDTLAHTLDHWIRRTTYQYPFPFPFLRPACGLKWT